MESYEKLVYTICYQFTHDEQLAQDLTQETFLSAYLHIDDCKIGQHKPWLARIATNKAKDYLKSAYHRRVNAFDTEGFEALHKSDKMPIASMYEFQPENIAMEKAELETLREHVLSLSEPYYKVAKMYFLQEENVDDIAKKLNRPKKTVHTQIYRAKNMLRQALKDKEAAP